MADNRVLVAYGHLASSASTPMPPHLQMRIFAAADRADDMALAALVASRRDACPELLDAARTHRSAQVASAWFANPATDLSEAMAVIASERRVSVLAAIPEHPDCPVELLVAAARRSTSPSVTAATLSTGRLPTADAVPGMLRVLASSPKRLSKTAAPLRAATCGDPALTAAVIAELDSPSDVLAFINHAVPGDPMSTEQAFSSLLDRWAASELSADDVRRQVPAATSVLRWIANSVTDADDQSDVAAALVATIDSFDATLSRPDLRAHVPLRGARDLAECRLMVVDQVAEDLGNLDDIDLSDTEHCLHVLRDLDDVLLDRLRLGGKSKRSKALEALTLDMFAANCPDTVLAAALCALERTVESLTVVLDSLRAAGTPVPARLLVRLVNRRNMWGSLDDLAACCDDRDAFLLGLLASPTEAARTADEILYFDELSPAVVAAVAEVVDLSTLTTVKWGLDAGPVRVAVTAALLARVADELADCDEAWEFFESCGGAEDQRFPEGTSVVEAARFAAALTSPT